MNLHYHISKRSLALLALVAINFAACQSPQNAADKLAQTGNRPPIPHMWMSDSLSKAAETNFLFFDSVLTGKINGPETDSIYYPLAEFRGLVETCGTLPGITYLDIYPVVPTTTGKLSLLFVPKDSQAKTLARYILPENSTSFDRQVDSVPPLQAAAWVANYRATVCKWLNPWLDTADAYNYLGCDSTKLDSLSNTLHVAHFYTDFAEIDSEVNYQLTAASRNISGFKAFFSSWPARPKGTRQAYSNRILPILEFTMDDQQGRHRVVGIDTTGRQYQGPHLFFGTDPCKFRSAKGDNNGQMCPPTCNP